MGFLFFDTETTFKHGAPRGDIQDKHITQIAAILDDDNGVTRGILNVYVKVGSYKILPEAVEYTGITNEILEKFGMEPIFAIAAFHSLALSADVLVAHNSDFDLDMLNIEYSRLNRVEKFTSEIKTKEAFCTMKAATNITKLPGRIAGQYKWPKLDEAYRALVNPMGFTGAHDALNDVRACRELFYKLKTAA